VLALGPGFGNAFALALQHDLPFKFGEDPMSLLGTLG
jgi:hypothetical protein